MNESAIPPLPFGVEWRIRTASVAAHLFSHGRDPEIDDVLGMPARQAGSEVPALTVTDLLRFLNLTEPEKQPPGLCMVRLITDMVRVGLLMDNPTSGLLSPDLFGRSYWTIYSSGVQLLEGQLWLSELIGAGVIIPKLWVRRRSGRWQRCLWRASYRNRAVVGTNAHRHKFSCR